MNFTSNFKKYTKLSGINKCIFLLILNIFLSSFLNAQTDIKAKVDAQTYSEYSKAIDLFEKVISPNDVVTLFVPINYSFSRLSQNKQDGLNNYVTSEINEFLNNHKSNSLIDLNFLNSNLKENSSQNLIYLANNKKIYFQKNINNFLLGDAYDPSNVLFESHILKSINLDNKIILNFLDGIFLY
jgi:hypothetical protein